MNNKLIYISGPITGINNYMDNFAVVEKYLINKGYKVINPAKFDDELPKELTYEQFMHIDLVLLSVCNCIYMLKGWEKSKGANIEYINALSMRKEVLYQE